MSTAVCLLMTWGRQFLILDSICGLVMCCWVHVGLRICSRRQVSVTFVLCVSMQCKWFFVVGFIACVWIYHKQLFYKLLVENRYFVPIPVFEHQKQLTGSFDHGIVSPNCNVCWMCLHERLQLMLARAWSRIWDFLMQQFWMSGTSLYSSAERPFIARGPLERLCRVAFCCTRATWKAVQSGLLLH